MVYLLLNFERDAFLKLFIEGVCLEVSMTSIREGWYRVGIQ